MKIEIYNADSYKDNFHARNYGATYECTIPLIPQRADIKRLIEAVADCLGVNPSIHISGNMKNFFTHIKNIYTEHPDVQVIELLDGSTIGINEESICFYKKELFEVDGDTVCIERQDQREFLIVWGHGYEVSQPMKQDIHYFKDSLNIKAATLLAVERLKIGESYNQEDEKKNLSIVRTR